MGETDVHFEVVWLGIVDDVETYAVDMPVTGLLADGVEGTTYNRRMASGTIEHCCEFILAIAKMNSYDPTTNASPYKVFDIHSLSGHLDACIDSLDGDHTNVSSANWLKEFDEEWG